MRTGSKLHDNASITKDALGDLRHLGRTVWVLLHDGNSEKYQSPSELIRHLNETRVQIQLRVFENSHLFAVKTDESSAKLSQTLSIASCTDPLIVSLNL